MQATKNDYIQKYIWYDHGRAVFNAWQFTLTNTEAIAFLAFIAVLLAYAQTRTWSLARQGVRRLTRPVQLPDDSSPDSLTKLSQKEAIRHGCSLLFDVRKSRNATRSMTTISPWFGVAATLNLIAFACLGAVLPWALSGGLETPVVQSRTWPRCYANDPTAVEGWTEEQKAYIANDKYRKCWFNKTEASDACGRETGILMDRPEMLVSRNVPCPFAEAACSPETRPLQLEYINVTLRDVGLNVKSDLLLSRRLTCSPLNITNFLRHEPDGSTWLYLRNSENSTSTMSWSESGDIPILRQRLSSHDGRRRPLPDMHWLEGHTPDLRYWSYSNVWTHPSLRRTDGDVFVLVYDAGRAVYRQPVSDPMYSAHQRSSRSVGYYFPDFEYTAMACLEQHRLCRSSSPANCSSYTARNGVDSFPNWRFPGYRNFKSGRLEVMPLDDWEVLTTLGEISSFVGPRGAAAMLTFERNTWNNVYIPIDPLDQWAWDVKSWFESSFLMVRQNLLVRVMGDPSLWVESQGARETLCGRVLLLDGDYTNINFLGFILTVGAVAILSGLSHLAYLKRLVGIGCRLLEALFRRFSRFCFSLLRDLCGERRRGIRDSNHSQHENAQGLGRTDSTNGDSRAACCELELGQ